MVHLVPSVCFQSQEEGIKKTINMKHKLIVVFDGNDFSPSISRNTKWGNFFSLFRHNISVTKQYITSLYGQLLFSPGTGAQHQTLALHTEQRYIIETAHCLLCTVYIYSLEHRLTYWKKGYSYNEVVVVIGTLQHEAL